MKQIELSQIDIFEINELAAAKRRLLGFSDIAPIANDFDTVLEKLDIKMLELPIQSEETSPSFSAMIMFDEENELTFIGVNTANYYDNQIFAIAHELYHFFTKKGYHLSRIKNGQNTELEEKANKFASEFILPELELEKAIFKEFKTTNLYNINQKSIIRFISRIYMKWWFPYSDLIRKLYYLKLITIDQLTELSKVCHRDEDSEFGRVCKTIDRDLFLRLNNISNATNASPDLIEIIIKNFEDNLINEDELEYKLNMFDLSPSDFGYEIEISQTDLDEFESFLEATYVDGN